MKEELNVEQTSEEARKAELMAKHLQKWYKQLAKSAGYKLPWL